MPPENKCCLRVRHSERVLYNSLATVIAGGASRRWLGLSLLGLAVPKCFLLFCNRAAHICVVPHRQFPKFSVKVGFKFGCRRYSSAKLFSMGWLFS